MSLSQNLTRLCVFSVLLISTSQCIPTRRPSPTCLKSQPLPQDASVPKQDVIGGYLVFEKHLEPGSSTRKIGRFPSIFHVEKVNDRFQITVTAPRADFNIFKIKQAFAMILLADGSQASVPLQNKEMQVIPSLQRRLEATSFDASSTSETVRDQGQRDQKELLNTFSSNFFGSKNLSTLSLQNLLNTVSQEKKSGLKEITKLQMLRFTPSFSQEAIAFAFNQTTPLGSAFLISSTSKINSTLQRLADLSQSHDSKPLLQQAELDHVARLHLYLDRLDQLESNMRSFNLYKKLSLCNTNAASALCRQRSKLTDVNDEFFGFVDDKCDTLSFDAFKKSLEAGSTRNIRSCESGVLLYSVQIQLKNDQEADLDAIESSLQDEAVVLHDKIQEVRGDLANVVNTNPDFLQLRTVMAASETGHYQISDDKSYFGGVTIQQNSFPQNVDLKKMFVDSSKGLKLDIQFALRFQDMTKCSMTGAAITLGGLPIDLARGGCLRIFNANRSDEPGQIAENPQNPGLGQENDPPSEKDTDAPNPGSGQTEITEENPEAESKVLPVILIPVRTTPTEEELKQEREAVNQLGSGVEREAQSIPETISNRHDDPGC